MKGCWLLFLMMLSFIGGGLLAAFFLVAEVESDVTRPAEPPSVEVQTESGFGMATGGWAEAGDVVETPFDGQAGECVQIGLEVVAEALDPRLEVLGPSGDVLAEDDNSGTGTNALIERLELPTNGRYIVQGEMQPGLVDANGASYTLSVMSVSCDA